MLYNCIRYSNLHTSKREECIMAAEINHIKVEKDFKICPVCGYELGFHSVFERVDDSNELTWTLICPSCKNTFDIGLKVSI